MTLRTVRHVIAEAESRAYRIPRPSAYASARDWVLPRRPRHARDSFAHMGFQSAKGWSLTK
jgi:hypothetical protein